MVALSATQARAEDRDSFEFTLAGWIRPGPLGGVQHIIPLTNTVPTDGLVVMPDGRLRFGATFRDGWKGVQSAQPLVPGVWAHVAVTFDDDRVALYVNGVVQARQRLEMGRRDRPGFARALYAIDMPGRGGSSLRLYRRALTGREIVSLMAATKPDLPPPPVPQVATPVFSYPSGTYSSALVVTVTDATAGATIRYTTNGSDPIETSALVPDTGISVDVNTVLKARAWNDAQPVSDVAVATYALQAAPPTLAPAGGTFSAAVDVVLSAAPGTGIHYTTDGSDPTAVSTLYTGPLRLTTTSTVKAIAARAGWDSSTPVAETYRFFYGTLDAPVFAPAPGTYQGQVSVTIGAQTGAGIRYTTDGSVPTVDSRIYSGPIVVSASETIRAQAFRRDYGDSAIVAGAFGIAARTPVILPSTGTYTSAQSIRITDASPLAQIHYTLDGSEPTAQAPLYAGPFTISDPTVVKARAFGGGLIDSAVATASLTFQTPAPTAAPSQGVYLPGQVISLVSDSQAEIRYTLDGSDPTPSSTVYAGPFPLSASAVVKAVALRSGWLPSVTATMSFTIASDVTAPVVTASVSPAPSGDGWNSGSVTVTFTCADAESAIAACTTPKLVSGEGRNVSGVGYGRDAAGNVGMTTGTVNVDRTAPILSVFSPRAADVWPLGTGTITVRGGVADLSGISVVTCAGSVATVTGQSFSCEVPISDGANVVRITAADFAGHLVSRDITIQVGEGVPPAAIRITPAAFLMGEGETRELAVADERGRSIAGGEWSVDAPLVAQVTEADGIPTLEALSSGRATVTVTYGILSAHATVTVLGASVMPSPGTVLWSLGDTPVPARGVVIPATPTLTDDPQHTPAMFFVDEAVQWVGVSLTRTTSVPVTVRAAAADGRELWSRTSPGGAIIKHAAADQDGGLVIVWSQWFDQGTGTAYPDTVERLARDGTTTWTYVPTPGAVLSDVAIHPNGKIYFVEQRLTGLTNLVAVTPGGDPIPLPLPMGHFTQIDTGEGLLNRDTDSPARPSNPIIRDDGSIIVVTQRMLSLKYVTSWFQADGLHSRDDVLRPGTTTSFGDVVEIAEGGVMTVHTLPMGPTDWNTFRPEDYRLLPDGQGGFLLGHRAQPLVVHITADYEFAGLSRLFDTTGMSTYGSEYVLGDDGAHLLVHGMASNGAQHWTRDVRFDPLSLTVTGLVQVGPVQASPTYLRLQYATAGGGINVSGPTTPGGGHAAPVAGDVWGGWSGGPATILATYAAKAETEWPSRQGTARGTNVAFMPGYGIYAKSHTAGRLGGHVSVRIVPRDQAHWLLTRPDDFKYVDERGRRFATIGAGPPTQDTGAACDGSLLLVSAVDREGDVFEPPHWLEKLEYSIPLENDVIQHLFGLDAFYADNLPYCFLAPPFTPFYNSNSYSGGLIKAAGVPRPLTPAIYGLFYPGWFKPVPAGIFGVRP